MSQENSASSAPVPPDRTTLSAEGEWPPVPRRRKIANAVFWAGCFLGLALIVAPALWLVVGVICARCPDWRWSVLTTDPGPGRRPEEGGLRHAADCLGVLIIAGVISMFTGMYLSEFGRAG